jgi:cysteine synthase A
VAVGPAGRAGAEVTVSEHEGDGRFHGLRCLVGNTPLLAIRLRYRSRPRVVHAKAEHINMTGSIKDRMALFILQRAYRSGALTPGQLIVEATSGNTGISIAAIGRALGHPVAVFMPDWMSRERINLIRALGARIHLVSRDQGGFLGSIDRAEALAAAEGGFLPRQFSNRDNSAAHFETTGPEIWWQLAFRRLRPDAFVAGVGTGGTVMGAGGFLRQRQPRLKVHPLEPADSPTLSTGCKVGRHRIQGISDEFVPPIVDLKALDEVIGVHDGDAILMAQRLAAELGIGVGISAGANFLGAVAAQDRLGGDAVVVTVFPDDNKKYLSTDLLGSEPVRDGYLSPAIELDGFGAYKRVCHTCCDPAECLDTIPPELLAAAEEPLPPCPRRLGLA